MSLRRITAAEAAAYVENGQTIGLGGFTPSGVPKAITPEIAAKAHREHEAGRPFKINLYTGASTGQSADGILAEEKALNFRAPYTTNSSFRKCVNRNEIKYTDLNLSCMANKIRQGHYGEVDWAIIEVCAIEEHGEKVRFYPTVGVGIIPTIARVATRGIFLELNRYHSDKLIGMHDIYEIPDVPFRTPINIMNVNDRIGVPYVEVEKSRIVGVVEVNLPDEARAFKESCETTDKIGNNVADFLLWNMKKGYIPKTFLNLQSGVGSGANAVLQALGGNKDIPDFSIYTEVLQNACLDLMLEGRIKMASTCSLTVTGKELENMYSNIDLFKERLVLRPSEISNSPEVISRIGVCSMNTALEVDIYGDVNSTKVCGTKMMNGIGGSADFTNSAYISIFTCGSTAKDGKISSVVPFCSHVDHTSHFVCAVVTEYGVADLRGKCTLDKAKELIKVAHPDYRPILEEYMRIASAYGGHTHHCLSAAFALHDTYMRKGDMRLIDWSEYIKE